MDEQPGLGFEPINIGDETEDDVQAFVERAFSPFFVFRSPRQEESGRQVTDVLVVWDDVALVIEGDRFMA